MSEGTRPYYVRVTESGAHVMDREASKVVNTYDTVAKAQDSCKRLNDAAKREGRRESA